MTHSNDKKTAQLGMPLGTAQGRLRKQLLFKYIIKAGDAICYRCGKPITNEFDLSIDHKEAWLDSKNPKQLFWDLNNISFSHLKCNIGAANQPEMKNWHLVKAKPEEQLAWCNNCKDYKPYKDFYKNSSRLLGLQNRCKDCCNI